MRQDKGRLLAAWVLHRRAYRDTSLIVELFTADQGRVGLVARGARGSRSRWRGLLEPFQPVVAEWRGRGELQTLVQAEPAGPALRLPGRRLASGFYVNELMLRLVRRGDPAPELFAAYSQALRGLSEEARQEGAVLRVFERDLLRELGYALELRHTAGGDAVSPKAHYRYDADAGPVPVAGPGPRTVSGAALLALADGYRAGPDRLLLDEARSLMQAVLAPHLGQRPLQSRQLYRNLLKRGDRDE
ncbi:MAG: DNA repair protein RecO [Ectothiorhodospiraceae bacterium]|nr:DNA repair protein RecO [Ectothiorhodospiraceae bacterium]